LRNGIALAVAGSLSGDNVSGWLHFAEKSKQMRGLLDQFRNFNEQDETLNLSSRCHKATIFWSKSSEASSG